MTYCPITLAGRFIVMPKMFEEQLQDLFCYTHRETIVELGQPRQRSVDKALYAISGPDLLAPRGFLYAVEKRLGQLGIQHEIVQDMEPPRADDLFSPKFNRLGKVDWRVGQFDVICLPGLFHDGIIDAVTGYGKSFMVKQIAQAYPNARIVVVVPWRDLSDDVYRGLLRVFGDNRVGRFGDGHSGPVRRITVTTPESLIKIQPDWPDIILYDEVHTAASDERSGLLMNYSRAKMFGFTGTSDGRSDGAEKRVEGIFGPIRIVVDYRTGVSEGFICPVVYEIMPIRAGVRTTDYRDAMDRWRYPIWKNNARNHKLCARFLGELKRNPNKQALFSVERTEHALYIQQQFLKMGLRIPIISGKINPDDRERFEKHGAWHEDRWIIDQRSSVQLFRQRFTAGTEQMAIATSTFSTGADFVHLKFMIYGSGSPASIAQRQWTGRLMRMGDHDQGTIEGRLVDTRDEFCETAFGRFSKRAALAKKLGWGIEYAR